MISWLAKYTDGSSLTMAQNKLTQEKIDRSKLKSFSLLINDRTLINCEFFPGQYFQYRTRNTIESSTGKGERVHIIVRQNGTDKTIIFVYEKDLSIHVTTEFGGGPLQHEIIDDPSESVPIGVK